LGALVLSVLFVGLELRQNTRAQRAQTRQELANSSREWLLTNANNPTLARAYNAMFGGLGYTDSTLTPVDSLQGRILMIAAVRHLENVWLQTQEGVADEALLDTYGFRAEVWQSPGFRAFWQDYLADQVEPRFRQVFEERNGLP